MAPGPTEQLRPGQLGRGQVTGCRGEAELHGARARGCAFRSRPESCPSCGNKARVRARVCARRAAGWVVRRAGMGVLYSGDDGGDSLSCGNILRFALLQYPSRFSLHAELLRAPGRYGRGRERQPATRTSGREEFSS